jgi:hypothetical protein
LNRVAAKSTKAIFKPLSGIEIHYLPKRIFSPFDATLKNDAGAPPQKNLKYCAEISAQFLQVRPTGLYKVEHYNRLFSETVHATEFDSIDEVTYGPSSSTFTFVVASPTPPK